MSGEFEPMVAGLDPEPLTTEDQALLESLLASLANPSRPELTLSTATVASLEHLVSPEPLSASLRARIDRLAAAADADLAYESHLGATGRRATLANYVTFLRGRSGLSAGEAAQRCRIDFHWWTGLERNLLRPQQIPATRLAKILRLLQGSLQQAEALLGTTIRAPRLIPASTRDSLFRGGASARGLRTSPPDPERENPEYTVEFAAVQDLRAALQKAWR